MTRSLIFQRNNAMIGENLTSKTNKASITAVIPSINLDKQLRIKRSEEYRDLAKILDANGCLLPQDYVDDIVKKIKGQFEELSIPEESMPVALVGKCYLGDGFEVHKLDISFSILKHYKSYEKMDELSERARNLSQNSNYDFIEVYSRYLMAVHHDGTVSQIRM